MKQNSFKLKLQNKLNFEYRKYKYWYKKKVNIEK